MQLFHILVIACVSACSSASALKPSNSNTPIKSRQKRYWLTPFPYNSCYALAVVMAIPLELKGRNVYMSWNFETNYYFPYFDNVQGLVPLPFATIDQEDTDLGTILGNKNPEERKLNGNAEQINSSDSSDNKEDNTSTTRISETTTPKEEDPQTTPFPETSSKPAIRASREILEHFMTRARFYKILETKMNSYGMHGRKCLQKAICDVASNPVGEHNGIIGDIVHIIFTPSASKDEHLPRDLYEAEKRGKADTCQTYHERCPTSVLDVISMYS